MKLSKVLLLLRLLNLKIIVILEMFNRKIRGHVLKMKMLFSTKPFWTKFTVTYLMDVGPFKKTAAIASLSSEIMYGKDLHHSINLVPTSTVAFT